MANIKDVVRTLSGSNRIGSFEYPWMVQTVLTADGMYYAIVELSNRVTSTKEVEKEEDAKNMGCQILASWFDEVKKKVGV